MNPPASPTLSPVRVLLAEASPLVREGLRQMIAEVDGVTVAGEAASCAGLESLLGSTEADLILLDLSLPCPDLAAAIRRYRAARTGVRVIALSQFDSPALDRFCLRAGADAILSKTAGLERLAEAVVAFAVRSNAGEPCQQANR